MEHLETFKRNNPQASVRLDNDQIIIEKPWGADNVAIVSEASDGEFLEELERVLLNPAIDAVIHLDTNTMEVLLGYIDPSDEIQSSFMNTSFTVHYCGSEFTCSIAEPSDRVMAIARRSQSLPSSDFGKSVPQIHAFRDAQRLDELAERAQRYFANKIGRNFHIKCNQCIKSIDLEALAHHINFISDYYDRFFPEIFVRDKLVDDKQSDSWVPLRYISEGGLPSMLSVVQIDDIVLQLIRVARRAPSRQAFLYYYQVIEYAGHYFIEEKTRSKVRMLLRDPSVINCDERKIREFMSLFTTQANLQDETKMKKAIEEIVDPRLVWLELEHDREFFSANQEFDGGFEMTSLITKNMTFEDWRTSWVTTLFERLTKIRNALVHARERRENKVILPTPGNNQKITRYEPVIARLAQQIALGMLT